MLNFFAFLFALTLLVSVHEWGHYRVAVALGVKVLRFSVGLGRPLWRFRQFSHGDELATEWTVGWLPLGGFVELMDESQGNVCPNQVHQALNRQPLGARALIVVAGPLANLVLAVVLLSFAAGWGQPEPMAVLSTPIAQSPADKAGLRGGELVVSSAVGTADAFAALHFQSVSSYSDLITQAMDALHQKQDWVLKIQDKQSTQTESGLVHLSFSDLLDEVPGDQVSPWLRWGLNGPQTDAKVIKVEPKSPAALAGLQPGDQVLSVNGRPINDAQFLRQAIRTSKDDGVAVPLLLVVQRHAQQLDIQVVPNLVRQDGGEKGRIGVVVGASPRLARVEHGVLESISIGIRQSYSMIILNFRMVGAIFTVSGGLDQLGGPLTIADQAANAAQSGLSAYLGFLGFLSISLAVLNLLPLPLLDGGHLMYYLWELITGNPVSSDWANVLQKVGLMLLASLMVIAVVNDGIRMMR